MEYYFEFQSRCMKMGFLFLLGMIVLAACVAITEEIVKAIRRRKEK